MSEIDIRGLEQSRMIEDWPKRGIEFTNTVFNMTDPAKLVTIAMLLQKISWQLDRLWADMPSEPIAIERD